MAEPNLDKFDFYVGSIFATLLVKFPCRTRLDFVTLAGAEEFEGTLANGRSTGRYLRNGIVEDLKDEFDFIYETVHWLFEAGYFIGTVGLTSIGRNIFVTLSPKALEILRTVPASVDSTHPTKSIGQELTEAVKTSAKKKVGELAGEALGFAIKLGWDAIAAAQRS